MRCAIKTEKLRKEYDSVVALKSLDMEIPAGETYGLIGPNGAGKSTLLKLLATAIKPDFGFATVEGANIETQPIEARKKAGFMPDFYALYEQVVAEDFLTYFALAYGVSRESIPGLVDKLLADVNLTEKRKANISELSRGMRQRLVFAKTLIHDPPVLLLDEPLSGLDPKARAEMIEILRLLRKSGKTVVISSHILSELSALCTSIGIIEKGEMKITGTIDEVRQAARGAGKVEIELISNAAQAANIISGFEFAEMRAVVGNTIVFDLNGDRSGIALINEALVQSGFRVVSISDERLNLEDIYFKVSSHEVQ
ncbi:MAG TPA: ABC transporter ATP-binding protein [bacterium]|nr:ABC transporter ATP-binding protein [bacterium]